MVSSNSATDSLTLTGTGLDTELSSILQGLGTVNSASYSDAWVSIDDLVDYLGPDTLCLAIPATGLAVQAGEDLEAWTRIPEGETNSQPIADLESLSWILLNDLVCGLTENAFIRIQSILVHQQGDSSNPAVYVSLADQDSTLGGLPLDHTPDTFLYSDIAEASSNLGLGNDLDTVTPPPENLPTGPLVNASTQVKSETNLLAPCDDPKLDANIFTDGTSGLLTSTPSSLYLNTDRVNNLLCSSVDVDVASDPGPSSPSDLAVSASSRAGNGN